ncbi:MAG TPA: pyridoxal-phosphate dependent enzyme [Solirubrobacteraceae bacterium]|nr:pyridoxal-phosphate dependent enzyme [Solirubrobacteraceae bacterium]
MIEVDDVRAAARVLNGVAHRTPVLSSRTLDELVGARVLMKAEIFQRGGAFKLRGAYNRIHAIPESERSRGVLAVSSGNHAQGVALAAAMHDIPATIVMPLDSPASKLAATRGYGAEIVTYDRFTEDRETTGRALAEARGLTFVHPYDDELVMAGQGTAALELLEESGGVDVMIVPVGGGGLLAGTATVVKGLLPDARVFGVEPEAADDHARSFAAGERVRIEPPHTIADALGALAPGEVTWPVNRERVEGVVTVSDAELAEAMRFAHERMKLVVEPGGAAALAGLLAGRIQFDPGARIGLVLSGGNVDRQLFAQILSSDGQPQ